jgi:tetratricopeptide (TPR) repeat protein
MNNLALVYRDAGKADKAVPLLEQALAKAREKLRPDHPVTLTTMNNLALAYGSAGRPGEAVPLFERTLTKRREKLGRDHSLTLRTMNNLAGAYQRQGDFAKAERLLRESLALRRRKQPDAWTTFDTQSRLGAALLGRKQYAAAEPLLLAGYEGLKRREAKVPANARKCLPQALERLVRLYDAWGKSERAAAWRGQLGRANPPAR